MFDTNATLGPFRLLPLLGLALLLGACPPVIGDDDAADDDDDTGGHLGSAPVLTNVSLCEVPALANCADPAFGVRFDVTATDEDDDMHNPWYFVLIEGNNPVDGIYEGNLDSGATLELSLCGNWTRGADIAFELWLQDAEGNDSERWVDSWIIPLEAGDDDCEPDLGP